MNSTIIIDFNEIETYLYDNIATPYIKSYTGGGVETGYCLVDIKSHVITKYIVDSNVSDFTIFLNDSSQILKDLYRHPSIHINITDERYFRFWIEDPNYYLMWDVDMKTKSIRLKPMRKPDV